MSRVQYYAAATLDGYIAEADDSIDWLTGYEGSYEGAGVEPGPMGEGGSYEEFYGGIGALVSGSATYEFLLRHMAGGGQLPYRGKPYWVLTSRDLPLPQDEEADVRFAEGDVGALHAEIAEAAGEDNIWVLGGGGVASQFAEEGLLDDVIVTVVPVVLGAGKPLFGERLPGGPMQLMGTRVFGSGMVELRYEIRRA